MVELSPEQRQFGEAVRSFCAREFGSRERRDELTAGGTESHSQPIYEQMAKLGWLGVSIPEQYGGAGGGVVDACVFIENAWYGLAPIIGYSTSLIVKGPYLRFGTEAQKQAVLSGIANGRVEAIAMSEPGAGSDVAAMTCAARRDGDEWVINGQKTWISNAHIADHILVVVRTNADGPKHEGLTMLEVPADAEGVEIRGIDTMSGRDVNDVFFTDCRVPVANVVGEEGSAWSQLMSGLNAERVVLAAQALGSAQRAFDETIAYTTERHQFGQPIGSFQALKHRIADLATELTCSKLLLYSVAAQVDKHPERQMARESSMVKLKCTEVLKQVTLEGMQMMGGYGYASEYEMEGHVRKALVSTIYGGTSEIQRDIIGRSYGFR